MWREMRITLAEKERREGHAVAGRPKASGGDQSSGPRSSSWLLSPRPLASQRQIRSPSLPSGPHSSSVFLSTPPSFCFVLPDFFLAALDPATISDMAYRQQHDPYQNAQAYPDYPPSNTGAAPNYAYPQSVPQQTYDNYPQQEYDAHSGWDAKSTKSYASSYNGSQVHLNPGYEMSQVNVPPVPSIPYAQPNYPPQQHRPGMQRDQSSAGWSTAREKMMKRRSVRQVELQQGNLVLDMQVPTHIVPKGMDNVEEMTKLRYTAATCDPDDFMRSQYSLRPYLMGRKTELFIVMTMYNEDEVLFVRTMNGCASIPGFPTFDLLVLLYFLFTHSFCHD